MKINAVTMLKRLKDQGYDVRVRHLRPVKSYLFGLRTKGELAFLRRQYDAPDLEFEPKGGETVVEIGRNGVALTVTRANCCELDNFDRRRGLQIALGRAVKTLEPKGITV